ncbi:MAG: uroporphyrinogen decarboxylase [Cyanobacteria bacterium TGS_CYA1]|nr:uroporphyrinogen decarboxylase [Cyanobacteria bacterium TGS_CYA1]
MSTLKNTKEKGTSTFLRTFAREKTEHTPVWLMRQAGRYMKEYRDLKEKWGFLELCHNPELAATVTTDAAKALKVDAAIIFADILLILEALDLGLHFEAGEGPVIEKPIRSVNDVNSLPDINAGQKLSYVGQSIKNTIHNLGPDIPVIGFAGAPFTVASYAIEGGGSRNFEKAKSFMYYQSEAWHNLMDKLVMHTAAYLNMQVENGASVVQLFDSWVGALSPSDFKEFAMPHLKKLVASISKDAYIVYFGTQTNGLLEELSQLDAHTIGVDWRIDLDKAWDVIGHDKGIQGNLDPVTLFADKDTIKKRAIEILDKAEGRPGYIFNLGHGILPQTPVDNVKYLVEVVHSYKSK